MAEVVDKLRGVESIVLNSLPDIMPFGWDICRGMFVCIRMRRVSRTSLIAVFRNHVAVVKWHQVRKAEVQQ